MSYVNPLHPPVSPLYRSQFSTLGDAVSSPHTHTQSQFLSPTRRRLPQQRYIPSSKYQWRATTGRLPHLHPLISFDYTNHNRQGVSMLELTTRSMHAVRTMIQGADDQVFAGTGLARITLRIMVSRICSSHVHGLSVLCTVAWV
jgi:hypothetical protein